MKSRISIEVDFENGNRPVVQILFRQSSDVRDNLIQSFYQALGHRGSWCRIDFKQSGDDREGIYHRIFLTPITPAELPDQARLMCEEINSSPNSFPSQFALNEQVQYSAQMGDDHYWGKIVGVRFTEAKVYYDVIDDTTATVTRDIPSDRVEPLAKTK